MFNHCAASLYLHKEIIWNCASEAGSNDSVQTKLAGLPKEVIARANEILENLESNAIAEAGQPALAEHHGEEGKERKPRKGKTNQPTLFDWAEK